MKNPKLVDTPIVDVIPQIGPCSMNCRECFYNRPGAFYAPIDQPNVPTPEEVGDGIARLNCISGKTLISLVSGKEVSIESLVNGPSVWIYAYDNATGEIVPKQAEVIQTGISLSMLCVTLDNGKSVECTADHRWLLKDGTYCKAQNLKIGTSLMPLYRQKTYNYEQHLCPATGHWRYTHRWFVPGEKPTYNPDFIVHHINFNKNDNTPANLTWMTRKAHARLHTSFNNPMNDPAVRKRLSDLRKGQRGDKANAFNHAVKNDVIVQLYIQSGWSAARIGKHVDCSEGTVANRLRSIGVKLRIHQKTEAGKEATSKASKQMWQNKEKRQSILTAQRTEEVLKQKRFGVKVHRSQSGARTKHAKRISDLWKNPERRKKMLVAKQGKNHRVVSITNCSKTQPGYDLKVPNHHNFAVNAGVFIHNCGNDSNNQRALVIETAKRYKNFFFNTSICRFDFPGPVVLTANPHEEKSAHLVNMIPDNLMFVRLRTSATNLLHIDDAVTYYTLRGVPVVITFMSYYTNDPGVFYEWKVRHTNSYWCPTKEFMQSVMKRYHKNRLVSMCGSVDESYCKACRNCETYYIQTAKRLKNE